MSPFELTATPEASPRFIPSGSFRTFTSPSNGISGTDDCATSVAPSAIAAAPMNASAQLLMDVPSLRMKTGRSSIAPNPGRASLLSASARRRRRQRAAFGERLHVLQRAHERRAAALHVLLARFLVGEHRVVEEERVDDLRRRRADGAR